MNTTLIFIWLTVAVCFLLLEIGHPGLFFFLSFSLAALAGAKVAWLGGSFLWQLSAFLIAIAISFILIRYFTKRLLHHNSRTNMYALEGQKGVVYITILPDRPGQIKVNGEIWTAKSLHNELIPEGMNVQIINVRGAHVVVQKIVE